MKRQVLGLITLIAFVAFDWACVVHSVKKMPLSSVREENAAILGVMKKSGEYLQFAKSYPGRIVGSAIVVPPPDSNQILLSTVKSFKSTPAGVVYEVETRNGRIFSNITARIEGRKIIVTDYGPAVSSIPLSEVEMVWVEKVNAAGTFLATLGGIALVVGVVGLIIALTKESCPFIYSYDGSGYVFDAEPYGAATSRGMKRTEWCGLEHLRPVDGQYRLRLTNEVDETQHTDELKLVVVDHPRGLRVAPDMDGVFHTISDPMPPLSARDQSGRDLRSYVGQDDWIFWQSRVDDKDPDRTEDLRDELTFEFPRPAGTDRVKLVFNGSNTLWASQMLKRFLALYGTQLPNYYRAMDAQGWFYWSMMGWQQREELCFLRVRAEVPGGWKDLGTITGCGPFVSETRAYVLDIGDVPGETLRLKLAPPSGFWMINHVAVDYTPDQPVQATELEPVEAVGSAGQDIRAVVAREDDVSYDAPFLGDRADLTYLVPPERPLSERSVYCKVSGYYDIHMGTLGAPRWDILKKLRDEPGYSVRYSLQEYRAWRDGLRLSLD